MPCYDARDNEPAPFDHHNNPTAELLCGLLTNMEASGELDRYLQKGSKLWHWWEDHKERDRKKALREQEERVRAAKAKANRIVKLENELRKLKGTK